MNTKLPLEMSKNYENRHDQMVNELHGLTNGEKRVVGGVDD